jgi:hypothetical protein
MQARIQQQLVAGTQIHYRVRNAPEPVGLWTALRTGLGKAHCRMFHRSISRPVKGKYRCWKCLHEFQTNW